jgi:hypothetical protein
MVQMLRVSVAHVVGGAFHVPTMEDVKDHYRGEEVDLDKKMKLLISQHKAQAGIKIVHQCGVLIGEFKRVPAFTEANIISD